MVATTPATAKAKADGVTRTHGTATTPVAALGATPVVGAATRAPAAGGSQAPSAQDTSSPSAEAPCALITILTTNAHNLTTKVRLETPVSIKVRKIGKSWCKYWW